MAGALFLVPTAVGFSVHLAASDLVVASTEFQVTAFNALNIARIPPALLIVIFGVAISKVPVPTVPIAVCSPLNAGA